MLRNQPQVNSELNKAKPPNIWDNPINIQKIDTKGKAKYEDLIPLKPFKTCIKNALAIDFRNINITEEDMYKLTIENMPESTKIEHNSRAKILQLGFKDEKDRLNALSKGFLMDGCHIRKTKLIHESEEAIKLKLTYLSTGDNIEDTEKLITDAIKSMGKILEIQIKTIKNRIVPEALVFIEKYGKSTIPTEILVNDCMARIDYKNGPKRCFLCKRTNHVYKDCMKRRTRTNNAVSETLNQNSSSNLKRTKLYTNPVSSTQDEDLMVIGSDSDELEQNEQNTPITTKNKTSKPSNTQIQNIDNFDYPEKETHTNTNVLLDTTIQNDQNIHEINALEKDNGNRQNNTTLHKTNTAVIDTTNSNGNPEFATPEDNTATVTDIESKNNAKKSTPKSKSRNARSKIEVPKIIISEGRINKLKNRKEILQLPKLDKKGNEQIMELVHNQNNSISSQIKTPTKLSNARRK